MDIASLGIEIKTDDVKQATEDLDQLNRAGAATEQAATKVGASWSNAAAQMSKAGTPAKQVSQAFAQGTQAIQSQQKALSDLIGKIDPVIAAYARLDNMQEELGKHRNLLGAEDFAVYTQKIQSMRDALGATDELLSRNGNTAKQTAAALRLLPAQFTDIAVSLASGQNPFTVLLQQGGQIKDMFGGIGPAFSAMGRYALGLVNPLTVAGAAAAGLGLAFYDSEKTASAFNKALYAGAGTLGVSASEMQKLATQAGYLTGNLGSAEDAVIALGSAGNISRTQLQNLGEAASAISQYTGKGAADVAKDLASIGDSATDAAAKLSDKYGLITAAQFDVIRALDDQGEHQEALDRLSETLNQNAQERFRQYRASLSDIERDWLDIGNAISTAYSKVRSELFPGLNDQIAQLERIQQTRKDGGFLGGFSNLFAFGDNTNEAISQQLKGLYQIRDARDENATAQAEVNEANQKYIQLTKELDDQLANASPTSRRTAGIKKLNETFLELMETSARLGKSNPLLAGVEYDGRNFSGGAYDILKQGIESRIKDPKTPRAKAYQDDAATKMLQSLRDQQASLEGQLDTTEKLTTSQKQQLQFVQLIADLKDKKALTADQKSLLASQESIKTQLAKNVALDSEIQKRQDIQKLAAFQATIDAKVSAQQNAYDLQLAGLGQGSRARQQIQDQLRFQQDFIRERARLQEQYNRGDISKSLYEQETKAQQDAYDKQLAQQQAQFEKLDAAREDWANGVGDAWADYKDTANDAASQTYNLFTDAFRGTEDALTEFVRTGKLSFSDLADTIINDLIRIGVQRSITFALGGSDGSGGLMGWLGLASSASSVYSMGYASSSLDTLIGTSGLYAKGGAFMDGMQMFANGGAFTNSIVSSPTAFGMGNGRMGLMGEAGPEAIMPLVRTPDGALGVRSAGGQPDASGKYVVNHTSNFYLSGDTPVSRKSTAAISREVTSALTRATRYS
ncbi:phage tail tape measure protein [Pseudomonas pseudonitroreducens]|uniref:phage tail tape measure protein n=1 Tax=Pseudomonas pseudonitroreducens TaxID=2892326 RepID=UPI001F17852A|nr:phage tail tape measure protein [Pseudomonas pseudonitroreducens]